MQVRMQKSQLHETTSGSLQGGACKWDRKKESRKHIARSIIFSKHPNWRGRNKFWWTGSTDNYESMQTHPWGQQCRISYKIHSWLKWTKNEQNCKRFNTMRKQQSGHRLTQSEQTQRMKNSFKHWKKSNKIVSTHTPLHNRTYTECSKDGKHKKTKKTSKEQDGKLLNHQEWRHPKMLTLGPPHGQRQSRSRKATRTNKGVKPVQSLHNNDSQENRKGHHLLYHGEEILDTTQTTQGTIYKIHRKTKGNSNDTTRIYLKWINCHLNHSIAKSQALRHQPYRGDILAKQNQCQFHHPHKDRNISWTLEQSRNTQGQVYQLQRRSPTRQVTHKTSEAY